MTIRYITRQEYNKRKWHTWDCTAITYDDCRTEVITLTVKARTSMEACNKCRKMTNLYEGYLWKSIDRGYIE